MVLPMMMPAIGMIAAPVKGEAPDRKIMASTGSTPAAMASAAHGHVSGAFTRVVVVRTATANITKAKPIANHTFCTAPAMIRDTNANWTVARNAAMSTSRVSLSRNPIDTATTSPVSTTRATPRPHPKFTVTP